MGTVTKQNNGVELNVKIAYAVLGGEVVKVSTYNGKLDNDDIEDAFLSEFDDDIDLEIKIVEDSVFLEDVDVEEISATRD